MLYSLLFASISGSFEAFSVIFWCFHVLLLRERQGKTQATWSGLRLRQKIPMQNNLQPQFLHRIKESESLQNASKWPETLANNKEYNMATRLVNFIHRTWHFMPFEQPLTSHTDFCKWLLFSTTQLESKSNCRSSDTVRLKSPMPEEISALVGHYVQTNFLTK